MNKTLLLTAASIIALCAGGAFAAGLPTVSFLGQSHSFQIPKGAKVLWNQNSDYAGDSIGSQNFTGGTSSGYNDQAADDFVIPKGQAWTITKVDAIGIYATLSGPATSENVIFYEDQNGMPGKPVKDGAFANLNGGYGPDFAIKLPRKGLQLKSGRYWVSVIANMDFASQGQWDWNVNSVQHGDQAMWQNPGRGFGECATWCTLESMGITGPDLMFALRGLSKRQQDGH